jgi:hypothetical protein
VLIGLSLGAILDVPLEQRLEGVSCLGWIWMVLIVHRAACSLAGAESMSEDVSEVR